NLYPQILYGITYNFAFPSVLTHFLEVYFICYSRYYPYTLLNYTMIQNLNGHQTKVVASFTFNRWQVITFWNKDAEKALVVVENYPCCKHILDIDIFNFEIFALAL